MIGTQACKQRTQNEMAWKGVCTVRNSEGQPRDESKKKR